MSCMTILFLGLQITRSDIRPHIKWGISMVTEYDHFNLPQGIVSVCVGQHLGYSLYHLRGENLKGRFQARGAPNCVPYDSKNQLCAFELSKHIQVHFQGLVGDRDI